MVRQRGPGRRRPLISLLRSSVAGPRAVGSLLDRPPGRAEGELTQDGSRDGEEGGGIGAVAVEHGLAPAELASVELMSAELADSGLFDRFRQQRQGGTDGRPVVHP
ncbi:hypothetical protein GCM10023235_02360 [Kitasatospora terrestris]|uniref:Uncharacterized protein n=1 Tax=Kitasatospora terrestris TaxID=258051 RepID=A0ABP9DAB3_9ACTN